MKSKDMSLIVVICIVSTVFALIISSLVFSSTANRTMKAEVVDKISPEFQEPDKRYFNDKSFNPTRDITIQDNQNNLPFKQSQAQ